VSTRNKSEFDAKSTARKKLKKTATHTKLKTAPRIRPTPIQIPDAKGSIAKIRKTFSTPLSKFTIDDADERMGALEKFRRMATVIQDSNDAITFQDLEGNILAWNRGAETMYGYTEIEALNMNIVDTVPNEYQEEARQFLSSLKRGELVPNLETKRKHKEGRIIDVWLTNTKLTDDRGHLTGIATTERDITQRKRAEASQYARSLIEASLDPLVTISPDGKITDVNEGSIKVTGVPREILVGTDFSDYFTEPEKAREGYQQVFANGFVTDYPLTIRHKDGRLTDVLYNASVYKDAGGSVLGVFAAARDVTERKRIAGELAETLVLAQQARADADKSNLAKDEFLAMLSHELRTPLTSILSWAQLLRMGKLDAQKTKRGIELVEQSAKAQGQLIDDLLDISRIQAGKLNLSVRVVDPEKIISAAIDATRSLAASKSVQIEVTVEPSIIMISADPIRLQQILWNLITNAIKFSAQGGKVWITVDKVSGEAEDCVRFQVRDKGKGIRKEFLPIIFERFTQIDSTSTRAYGGLGLGLAIVKDLTEMHNGTVNVESLGESMGSTFSVLFPLKSKAKLDTPEAEAEAEVEAEAEAEADVSLKGLRVLVVEDDQSSRDVLAVILQSFGAEVKAAASVSQALAIFEDFNPDVLVSDIAVPVEDGYSLIAKVRAMKSKLGKIPALALTAYAGTEDVQRAHLAGFNAHVAKPADANKLALAIARLAGRR